MNAPTITPAQRERILGPAEAVCPFRTMAAGRGIERNVLIARMQAAETAFADAYRALPAGWLRGRCIVGGTVAREVREQLTLQQYKRV